MEPRFSVIIPIYKVEKYLRECIESIISQDYDSIEVLLIDDGSPDNCPKICDEYSKLDKRIKVVHRKNGGLVSARQAGCLIAQGEYILNVDGDDWVKPDYFYQLNKIIDKYAPDYICFGAYHVKDGNEEPHTSGSKEGLYNKQDIQNEIYPYLIEDKNGRYFSPSIWSKAIKRSIYTSCQLSLDPKIKIGEDNACSKPALANADSLYVLDKCIYCYRLNPESMTKEKKAFSMTGPELIGKNFEKQIDMGYGDFQIQVYRSVVHNLFNAIVSQFNRKDKYYCIRKEISKVLDNEYYRNAIKKCQYDRGYVLGNSIQILMKYKMIEILALIAICKSWFSRGTVNE